jgi:hypothetical protein
MTWLLSKPKCNSCFINSSRTYLYLIWIYRILFYLLICYLSKCKRSEVGPAQWWCRQNCSKLAKNQNFSLWFGSGPVWSGQPDHLIPIQSGQVRFKIPDPVGSYMWCWTGNLHLDHPRPIPLVGHCTRYQQTVERLHPWLLPLSTYGMIDKT